MDTRVLASAYARGQRAALEKFGEDPGFMRHLTVPRGAMALGGAAGLWDMAHGRPLSGSVGTALGTGAGGVAGGWIGQQLGRRWGLPPGASQLAGAGLGALIGRSASAERRMPVPQYNQGYGSPYDQGYGQPYGGPYAQSY